MTAFLKDLGLVKALHTGPTAPSNKSMLWKDTTLIGVMPFKYFEPQVNEWISIASGGSGEDHLWTVELGLGKTIDIVAPFPMKILSKQTILGNPNITILINGTFPYTYGDDISVGSGIRISVVDSATTNFTIEAPIPGYTYFKADALMMYQRTIPFSSLPLSNLNNWKLSLASNIPADKVIHKLVVVATGVNDPVGDSFQFGLNSQPDYLQVQGSDINQNQGHVSVGNSQRTIVANENFNIEYLGGSGTVNTGTLRLTAYFD